MVKVGVVGGGTMGAGIAELAARAGDHVLVLERGPDQADAAASRIEKSTSRALAGGKITQQQADITSASLRVTVSVDDLADRDLIIEALPEVEALKTAMFADLDRIVSLDAMFATNTSSIPITRIASALTDPSRLVGVHFFNPVPVMPLVEIVPGLASSQAAVDRMTQYAREKLQKKTILVGDRSGFVVNALLIPYLISAVRMVESNYATRDDIDTGMVEGCAHRMGPLMLCDTIGLDVVLDISESLFREFRDPHLAPPPLLRRMVEGGRLGRKSGRGFYEYST